MGVKIYLTGRTAVEADGQRVIEERQFRGKQARLAFAYLVSERARPVPKGELAQVLWPGEMPPAWEGALSALLSRLRSLLSPGHLGSHNVTISSGFGLCRIILPSDIWIDLEVAAAAIDQAEAALRGGDHRRILGPATITANIARRPFLPGCDGPWVEYQQSRLQRQLIRALECHGKMWLSNKEPTLAVESAAEAVALDPFRESSYQLLMEAYAATGNRPEAVKTYHRLRGILADELGIDPSVESQALYQELLTGKPRRE